MTGRRLVAGHDMNLRFVMEGCEIVNLGKRASARIGVLGGSAALLAVTQFSGTALAATYPYDGQNPETAGCAADAQTMESAQVVTPQGVHIGIIELRYSLTCHAGWARLTLNYTEPDCGNPTAGYACAGANEIRNNDGRVESCLIYQGQTQCYTDMLYDKGLTSFAEAVFDTVSGAGTTRTASY